MLTALVCGTGKTMTSTPFARVLPKAPETPFNTGIFKWWERSESYGFARDRRLAGLVDSRSAFRRSRPIFFVRRCFCQATRLRLFKELPYPDVDRPEMIAVVAGRASDTLAFSVHTRVPA